MNDLKKKIDNLIKEEEDKLMLDGLKKESEIKKKIEKKFLTGIMGSSSLIG